MSETVAEDNKKVNRSQIMPLCLDNIKWSCIGNVTVKVRLSCPKRDSKLIMTLQPHSQSLHGRGITLLGRYILLFLELILRIRCDTSSLSNNPQKKGKRTWTFLRVTRLGLNTRTLATAISSSVGRGRIDAGTSPYELSSSAGSCT